MLPSYDNQGHELKNPSPPPWGVTVYKQSESSWKNLSILVLSCKHIYLAIICHLGDNTELSSSECKRPRREISPQLHNESFHTVDRESTPEMNLFSSSSESESDGDEATEAICLRGKQCYEGEQFQTIVKSSATNETPTVQTNKPESDTCNESVPVDPGMSKSALKSDTDSDETDFDGEA